MEIWKTIKDFENYEISNLGRVKSKQRFRDNNGIKAFVSGKILTQQTTKKGYKSIRLSQNKTPKTCRIHRLVAINFIDNIENKSQVNHINGIKTDNRVENLEWLNNRENVHHYLKSKTHTSKYIGVHKTDNKFTSQIRLNKKTYSLGRFTNEIDAKNAYTEALINYETKGILPLIFSSKRHKYISFNKSRNKFHLYDVINRKTKTIGFYNTIEEAINAYNNKLNEYNFNKTNVC